MIYSGDLRDILKFYHIVETQSPSGYKDVELVYFLTRRAYRLKNKENYVVNAGELFHINNLTFLLRDNKEIKETDIVEFDGNKYIITSMDRYNGNELLIIIQKKND